jgi:hypothetical protein
MHAPSDLARLERLFDLQMWAFGCDARHPEGNLFARRGMECMPPPPGAARSSTRTEQVGGVTVRLSSLGLSVRRGERELSLARGPLGRALAQAPELLPVAAEWVLAWERWVDQEAGPGWRGESLLTRRRPAHLDAAALRAAWAAVTAGAALASASPAGPASAGGAARASPGC